MIFPTDIPQISYDCSVERENNVLTSKKENGIVQTRRRYTRARKTYNVTWQALTKQYRDMLINFYDNDTEDGSLSFDWICPLDNSTIEVRFAEPIKETISAHNVYKITAKFVEV